MGIEGNALVAPGSGAAGHSSGRRVFSSDDLGLDLSNKARLTAWRDIYTSSFGATDIDWHGEGAFRAYGEFLSFEDAIAGTFDFTFHRASRSAQQVADDKLENLHIGFSLDTTPAHVRFDGVDFDAPPNNIVFYSSARPFEVLSEAGRTRANTLVLPHAVLAPVVPNLDDLVGRLLTPADPAVNLLKRYVELIMTSPGGFDSKAVQSHIRHTLLDLAILAIGGRGENAILAADRGHRTARLAAIKADVRDNIGRQDVSVQAIAMRHAITPRYLHMLFEGVGRTYSEFVMAERLAKAHRLLSDPRLSGHRIGDIAFSVGFADLSTFNRQFKRHYGVTPTDIRHAAMRGQVT